MKIPLKARMSIFRQRLVLTLRFYCRMLFRLPIDEIREQQRQNLDQQFAETLRSVVAIMNQTNTRLHWYETRVPLLRKEYKAFQEYQKKLIKAQKAKQEEFDSLIAEGVPEAVAHERVWPRPPQPESASVKSEGDGVVGEIEPAESSG